MNIKINSNGQINFNIIDSNFINYDKKELNER